MTPHYHIAYPTGISPVPHHSAKSAADVMRIMRISDTVLRRAPRAYSSVPCSNALCLFAQAVEDAEMEADMQAMASMTEAEQDAYLSERYGFPSLPDDA